MTEHSEVRERIARALGHRPSPGRSVDPNPFPRIRLWRTKETR